MRTLRNELAMALLSLFAGIIPIKSYAYDIEAVNEDGITIYYTWTNNKTELAVCTITDDFYEIGSGLLIIPAFVSYGDTVYPVTQIGQFAFYFCDSLKSVVMPNSIKTIGKYSFAFCKNLTDVLIPNSVKNIGDGAFYCCNNLENVTMSESVYYIGQYAFSGCDKLTSMTIPESVSKIGEYAFQDNKGLTSVKIYCREIGSWFNSCPNIKELVIGDNVKTIGELAFFRCWGLDNIIIPSSVTIIGERAFGECKGLTNVLIPNSVKEIGRRAFYECINLKKVVIEGNPIIKEDAFCFYNSFGKLDTIVLKSQTPPQMIYNPDYSVLSDGYPFTEHTFNNAILSVPEGYYYAYTASDTWSRFKHICTYSDNEYNSDFESDSIYYTLQEDGVYVTAHGAIIHNDNGGDGPLTPRDPSSGGLQPRTQTRVSPQDNTPDSSDYKPYRGNIMIPESVSVYDTVYTVTGINALAFQRCNELESVTIPNSVKRIGYASFAECTSLSEITIPAGVEFIDQYAFAYCSNLKRIVIQGNPEIDETAFIGCGTDLEVIYTVVENHKALDPDSVQEGAIHYGIDGRVIQSDTPGLHLIKHKDGTVTKTLVR